MAKDTFTCDDCRKPYAGPVYYTFGLEDEDDDTLAETSVRRRKDGRLVHRGERTVCTGNLCPSCAGPFLTPDDDHYPRWSFSKPA
jgi:hypothetical protein